MDAARKGVDRAQRSSSVGRDRLDVPVEIARLAPGYLLAAVESGVNVDGRLP